MQINSGIPSLRRRYYLIAVILVTMVLFGTVWGLLGLYTIQRDASTNLSARHDLLDTTHKIRTELLEAYRSMDIYLLEPGRGDVRTRVFQSLRNASQHSQALQQHPWMKRNYQIAPLDQLQTELQNLHQDIATIFDIRVDIMRQYPSMAVGNMQMNPARDSIDNGFIIVFNEMAAEAAHQKRPEVYLSFVKARRLWMQMLSNFRIYLANRVGSFNERALPIQEAGITTLFTELQSEFSKLEQFDAEGNLGFESSAAVIDLKNNLSRWYDGFEQVQEIHRSGEWRIDTKLVMERVIPSVDSINRLLRNLEILIDQRVNADVSAYRGLAHRHTILLWLVASAGVLLIGIIVWSSNRLLFKPLAVIAQALRAESSGKSTLELPVSRARETQELVDAFTEMRRQVRQRQAELEYRALHDSLTSLPNRVLLMDHVKHDITMARREQRGLGLMVLDLDHFKEINDTLGHMIGDRLLVEVGNRFRASLREMDTVARLGGDEFAVLMPNADIESSRKIAQTILDALKQAIPVNDMQLFVSASIGIAIYPTHGEDAKTLLQHADVAMYMAKHNQSGYALYDPAEDQHSIRRLALLNDMRKAIENNEFSLHFQPIFSVTESKIVAGEALLRWYSPEHGDVSPELVIDLAEQTGLIGPLTNWVIDESLNYVRHWREQGLDIRVSVNLSMHNLREGDLAVRIKNALQKYKLPCDVLIIEITESAMMFNPSQVISILSELDAMGIYLAIDDFGTGFSSLAYLKQLPVDEIKIDKSFVLNLATDEDDRAIVSATVNLAKNLGLGTVAEGVENAESWALLQSMGCDKAQGFHLSLPLPADEFKRVVASGVHKIAAPGG